MHELRVGLVAALDAVEIPGALTVPDARNVERVAAADIARVDPAIGARRAIASYGLVNANTERRCRVGAVGVDRAAEIAG